MNQQPEALRLANQLIFMSVIDFDDVLRPSAVELRRLHAENEALRKDAERYRWLRQMIYDDRVIVAPDRMLVGVELDEAADAAMKGQS